MPDYRLKNGTVWTVKDKDIESFMNSEHGKGATLIEDPSAKKEGPADVDPVVAPSNDTGSNLVDGSLEPLVTEDLGSRSIKFKDGVTVYEDVYIEKYAGKGSYPKTFDEYAELFKTKPRKAVPADVVLDEVVVEGKTSDKAKFDQKNAVDYVKTIDSKNEVTLKGNIGEAYFNLTDEYNGIGELEPKLAEREQRFKTLPDGRKSGYSEYVNDKETDLKISLGEGKYNQWQAIKKEAGNTVITKDNIAEFIDLAKIDGATKSQVVTAAKKKAAELFIYNEDLTEEEQRDMLMKLPYSSETKSAMQKELDARKQDAIDYKEKTGFPLVQESTLSGRVYKPLLFSENKGMFDEIIAKENATLKTDFEAIQEDSIDFKEAKDKATKARSQYEVKLTEMKDQIDAYSVDVGDYSSQEEVTSRNSLVTEYNKTLALANSEGRESWNELSASREALTERSDALTLKAKKLSDLGIGTEAIGKSYELGDQFAQVMEESFLGTSAMLGGSVFKLIGNIATIGKTEDEAMQNSFYRDMKNAKMAAVDYNARLRARKENYLPSRIEWDDEDAGWGDYISTMLVENSPSILTAMSTLGASSAGVVGLKAATNIGTSIFFTMEAGGQMSQLELAQRNASEVIGALEEELLSVSGEYERKNIFKQIQEQKDVLNLSQWQKSLSSVVYGGTAAIAERFGSLHFINNFQKYSRAVGTDYFKKVVGNSMARTLSKATGAISGVGMGAGIEVLEEGFTLIGQNISDVAILKEDKNIFEGLDKDFLANTLATSIAISGPVASQSIYSAVKSEVISRREAREESKMRDEIMGLQNEINSDKLTEEERKRARKKKFDLMTELSLQNTEVVLKISDMTPKEFEDVTELNREMRALENEAAQLGGQGDVSEYSKKELANLKAQYDKLATQRESLLEKQPNELNKLFPDKGGTNGRYNAGLTNFSINIIKNNKGTTQKVFKTTEEIIEFVKENHKNDVVKQADGSEKIGWYENQSKADKKVFDEGGFYALNIGNNIYVNKQAIFNTIATGDLRAGQMAAMSPLHELGHIQTAKAGIIKDEKFVGDAQAMIAGVTQKVSSLFNQKKVSAEDYKLFKDRMAQYTDANTGQVNADELIQLVGDFTNMGILPRSSFNSIFEIKNFVRNLMKRYNGDAEMYFRFDKPENVFGFVNSWTNKALAGKQLAGIVDPDKGSRAFSKSLDLKNQLKNLEEADFDFDYDRFEAAKANLELKIKVADKKEEAKRTVPKREVKKDDLGPNDPRSKEIMDVYNEGMKDVGRTKYTSKDKLPLNLENKLVPLFTGYINTIVNQKFKQTQEEGFSKEDALNVLEAHVLSALRTFNPSVNKDLAGYVKKYGVQARQSDMFKDVNKEYTEDISKAANVATEETSNIGVEPKGRSTKATKVLSKEQYDTAKKAVLEKIKDIDPSKRTYKKLGSLVADVTSELVGIPAGKIAAPKKNLNKAEATAGAMFIENNADYIRRTLPEGAVLEAATEALIGTSTGVPTSLLKTFYTKSERIGRGAGLSPWKLKPNLTSNDILKAIGRGKGVVKKPIDPRSTEGQIIKGIISLVDRNIANELARSPEVEMSLESKQDIGAGRNKVMFSKLMSPKGADSTMDAEFAVEIAKDHGLTESEFTRLSNLPLSRFKKEQPDVFNDVMSYFEESSLAPVDQKNQRYLDIVSEASPKLASFIKKGGHITRRKVKGNKVYDEEGMQDHVDNYTIPLLDYIPDTLGERDINAKTNDKFLTNAILKASSDRGNGGGDLSIRKANQAKFKDALSSMKKIDEIKASEDTKEAWREYEKVAKYLELAESTFDGPGTILRELIKIQESNISAKEKIVLARKLFNPKSLLAAQRLFKAYNLSIQDLVNDMVKSGLTREKAMEYVIRDKQKNTNFNKGERALAAFTSIYFEDGEQVVEKNKGEHVKDSSTVSALTVVSIYNNTFSNDVESILNGFEQSYVPKKFADEMDKLGGANSQLRNGRFLFNPEIGKSVYDLASGKTMYEIVFKEFNEKIANRIKSLKTIKTEQKAIDLATSLKFSKSPKKIRVFDFDDTLAQTKSNVLYTMPDGTKGKIDAATFAKDAGKMEAEGAVWDFSEFSKVMNGKKGPLFEVAKIIADKRGTEDVFVLTARPQDAAGPIQEFLAELGLDIPLKNITGLADGDPKAKANWMISKVAEGYNDFYFADDHTGNVKAVKELLDTFDVKGKVQQAKVKFSKSLDPEFNSMIERNKGVGADKEFSRIVAKRRGANKGKYKAFITSSADDFRGLTSYTFAGKGKQGEADQAFFEDALLTPYFRGVNALESARVAIKNDFTALSKIFKPEVKKLGKLTPDGDFTYDQAIRVYMWDKQGIEVPGLSKRDQAKLVQLVKNDAGLVAFSEAAVLATKKEGWVEPGEYWDAKTMLSDLNDLTETSNRADYLIEFNENADLIFSEKNLNKIEAVYGTRHREALEDALYAMKNGTNRTSGSNKITNGWNNWVNSSIGTIMFFNRRSATMQLLSSFNFLNWSDNNPLKAGIAFANQPQYWKDFAMIFNSDKLKQRRGGLKSDVQEAEIANAAKGAKNKPRAIISYLLKKGFAPTQIADSFAISMGGASMYRNRVNTYKKQGLDQKAAEDKAFLDFSKLSDETQQSGDPALVSQQQRSVAGRLILSFQNTTMQYTRLMKKSAQDLINGRGDPKTHISKILYYGAIQNFLFNALSTSLFAMIPGFEDEDDEEVNEKELDKKSAKILHGMFDSIAKGTGIHGAVLVALKNAYKKYAKEKEKGYMGQPGWEVASELLNIAPAIGSKFKKVKTSIDVAEKYDKDIIEKHPWDVNIGGKFNPSSTYTVIGGLSSALLNLPLDRALIEARGISEMLDDRNTNFQKIALGLGWRTWDVGAKNEEFDLIKAEAGAERKKEGKRKAKETTAKNKGEEKQLIKALDPSDYKKFKKATKGMSITNRIEWLKLKK